MIGQEKNIKTLINWRLNRAIPRFIIIEGMQGSGRLTFAKAILKTLKSTGVIADNGIQDVREIIANAYTLTDTTFYIFRNCDDMSLPAKNSLLKVVEEPPNKAYFIMTVQNLSNVLDTIKSRGTVIKMQPYTKAQLQEFKHTELSLKYASNPGDLDMSDEDIKKAENVVSDIIDALNSKSGVKLLKATSVLQSKKSDDNTVNCNLVLNILCKNLKRVNGANTLLNHMVKCKQDMSYVSVNQKASIEAMLIRTLEDLKHD